MSKARVSAKEDTRTGQAGGGLKRRDLFEREFSCRRFGTSRPFRTDKSCASPDNQWPAPPATGPNIVVIG